MSEAPESQLENAAEILRAARVRALGTRPGWRLLAISAWSGFIGAVALMCAWLLALPADGEPLDFGRLAEVFVVLWALACVPAVSAALLAQPPPAAFDPPERR
ncbi:hypothetical protein AAG565_05310 [Fontimonas sp. SYSU GA230001]|uniref:hypothetical protein n=1 Tax=Fontimonas sp. SYSU GA230001 TaxID=3142450 RepID=UPI0032B38341